MPVAGAPRTTCSATGRLGIMAPAQINDGDDLRDEHDRHRSVQARRLEAEREAVVVEEPRLLAEGRQRADQLPYLNKITFVPVVDASARDNQLQGGQLDVMHTSSALSIDKLQAARAEPGQAPRRQERHREMSGYYMLTGQGAVQQPDRPPGVRATRSTARRSTRSATRASSRSRTALWTRRCSGYLKNAGYPEFNLKKAKELVDQVQGRERRLVRRDPADDAPTPRTRPRPSSSSSSSAKAGINATIAQFDQSDLDQQGAVRELRRAALAQPARRLPTFRDQDNYLWFYTGSPVNFGHFNDPTRSRACSTRAAAHRRPSAQKAHLHGAQQGYGEEPLHPARCGTWTGRSRASRT